MKIYISGGITGVQDYMVKFAEVEEFLTAEGYEVINPAKVNANLPASTRYEEYMKMCMVMIDMCEAVFLIDGWEESRGARFEKMYADIMGKVILDGWKWLK